MIGPNGSRNASTRPMTHSCLVLSHHGPNRSSGVRATSISAARPSTQVARPTPIISSQNSPKTDSESTPPSTNAAPTVMAGGYDASGCCAPLLTPYRGRARRARLVADGGGLENRYGAEASSWVRIPRPPQSGLLHQLLGGVGPQMQPRSSWPATVAPQ